MDLEDIVIPGWLLIALLILLMWPFRPKRYFDMFDWRLTDWGTGNWAARLVVGFIGFSAFAGLQLVLVDGLKAILIFLPKHANGPSMRTRVASLFGLLIEIAIVSFLVKHNKKRREALHEREKAQE
jgi:hypothetical protein